MTNLPPLSLYIHFPWCVKKCPYCDFNSHNLRNAVPEEQYINVLLKDLDADLNLVKNRKIESIFMGGGTPSLFSPANIKNLLACIANKIQFAPELEITLEANPGTIDQEKFADYRKAGINRLSIGIQSFNEEKLKKLGRIHNVNEAASAVKFAKKASFTNFNIDLMFGLPEQTVSEALNDLQLAISFAPPHISWYQLTLEPNTLFYHQPPKMPQEEIICEIQQAGNELLKSFGYQQYEISAFSKDGYHCRHNKNYWEFGDYLGIGCGAHSKITVNEQDFIRLAKIKHPKQYLAATEFIDLQKNISREEIIFEFMLNALRLYQSISFQLFEERTGLNRQILLPSFEKAAARSLLVYDDNFFETTIKGKLFLNDLMEIFLL